MGYTPPPRARRRGPKPRGAELELIDSAQGGVATLDEPAYDCEADDDCSVDPRYPAVDREIFEGPVQEWGLWPIIGVASAASLFGALIASFAFFAGGRGTTPANAENPTRGGRESAGVSSAAAVVPNLSALPILEQAVDCEWQGADGALVAGRELPNGSLMLTRGAAVVRFVNGARLVLEAPVRFDVSSPIGCFMWSGRVVVQMPEGAAEFVVNTPAAVVGVSGAGEAEVGLQAEDAGATEVHVLAGRVDVQPRKNNPENRLVRRLQAGAAERYETYNRPGWQVIDAAGDGFLRSVSEYDPAETGSYAAVVLADQPVAFWRLAESSGDTVRDATSHGIAGRYQGALALGQPAAMLRESDPSVFFQGGWVSVARREEVQFDSSDSFSLETWVRTPVANIDMRPIGKIGERGHGGCPGYSMFIRDNVLVFQATSRFHTTHNQGVLDGDVLDAPGKTPICDGRWHHLVTTYDGSKKAAGVRLYVDGCPDEVDVAHPLYADMLTGSIRTDDSQLELARGGGQFKTNHFMGSLDDVAIYDYVLTAEKVQRHFDAAQIDHPDERR